MWIVHRCSCSHIDQWHTDLDGAVACTVNGCGCADATYGEPEVIPSWRRGEVGPARLDDTVQEPGSTPTGMSQLCGCERCHALYAELRRGKGVAA